MHDEVVKSLIMWTLIKTFVKFDNALTRTHVKS